MRWKTWRPPALFHRSTAVHQYGKPACIVIFCVCLLLFQHVRFDSRKIKLRTFLHKINSKADGWLFCRILRFKPNSFISDLHFPRERLWWRTPRASTEIDQCFSSHKKISCGNCLLKCSRRGRGGSRVISLPWASIHDFIQYEHRADMITGVTWWLICDQTKVEVLPWM